MDKERTKQLWKLGFSDDLPFLQYRRMDERGIDRGSACGEAAYL